MASPAAPGFDSNKFWKEQDYEQSARLHLQHWVWQYQLGYALHPSINVSNGKPLRIADVAAGNGAWMLELAKQHEENEIDLLGLDITNAHFPNAAWLPQNIRFATWDAYGELPAEYEGTFDVVHLRALYSTVKANNIDPLLANCLKMLKPGGHLQWDESDASTLACYTPNENVKADACKQIIAIQDLSSRMFSQLLPDWLHDLSATLEDRGCEVVAHDTFEPDKRLARAWTDNMLLVWRGVVPMIPEEEMPLPPGHGLPEKLSRAGFAQLFQDAVKETQRGVMLGMKYHVLVVKKKEEP